MDCKGHFLVIIAKDLCFSAILFPIVVTVYVTWWFLDFFDAFFSPLYKKLVGFEVFGMGFMTSMIFIFSIGNHPLIEFFVVCFRSLGVIMGRGSLAKIR